MYHELPRATTDTERGRGHWNPTGIRLESDRECGLLLIFSCTNDTDIKYITFGTLGGGEKLVSFEDDVLIRCPLWKTSGCA